MYKMLSYSLFLILVGIACCQSQNSDYPCSSRRCRREETCYPVVSTCYNDRCDFNSICLDHEKHTSPCEFGFPVLRANNTPHFCEDEAACPANTQCYHSGFYRVSVCCWGSPQDNANRKKACPKTTGFGSCVDQCRTDSHCAKGTKCCSNGCGHDCIQIQGDSKFKDETERPGQCPAGTPPGFMCNFRRKCSSDAECFGYFKCCNVPGCGSVCRPPKGMKPQLIDNKLYPSRGSATGQRQENKTMNPFRAQNLVSGANSRCPWFRRIYGGCINN